MLWLFIRSGLVRHFLMNTHNICLLLERKCQLDTPYLELGKPWHFHHIMHSMEKRPLWHVWTAKVQMSLGIHVAQLDARPSGDQEVAGSNPAEVGNILSRRLIMKYFLRSFSPFRWFRRQLSVSGKRMCIILVNRLED